MDDHYDAGDYETDDREHCHDCAEWQWPDAGEIAVCPECEERYCKECMPEHKCGGLG